MKLSFLEREILKLVTSEPIPLAKLVDLVSHQTRTDPQDIYPSLRDLIDQKILGITFDCKVFLKASKNKLKNG